MKSKSLFFLAAVLVSGCASTYSHSELKSIASALDGTKGVLVSTPQDGSYAEEQYRESGAMTANAVRSAFSKHASKVDVVSSCHGDDCLAGIDTEKYGYYVKPEILHWEDRATEWSGKKRRR